MSAIVSWLIPDAFKPRTLPEVYGTVAPGFEDVKRVFRKNYQDGWDNGKGGSAFAVYQKGKKVVDLWGGYADLEAGRLWKEDTMTVICSTTKALTALCVAMLVDRGLLDFKKPVAHYWPEFGQKGKDKVTVEQLLEHEAGLYITGEPLTYQLLQDHEALDKSLAESEPAWEPGTRHGYHGITWGPLVDGLFRRVDTANRTVGQFFDEEVREPFDIDAYIGVPLELMHRVARQVNVSPTWSQWFYSLLTFDLAGRNILSSLLSHIFGPQDFTNAKIMEHSTDIIDCARLADPDILCIEVASLSAVATARGVAKLFDILANGGKYGDKTLLSEKIIDEYINDKRGLTPDLVWYDRPFRWKYGMNVVPQDNAGNMFGCVGAGGQYGYADPNNHLAYGFVSRYFTPISLEPDERVKRLKESVLRAVENQ